MPKSILIIDDNASNLKLIQVLLMNEGFEVKTAIDAEQALSILEVFNPHLILMDIQLPGMDGLTLTRKLKSEKKHLTIVALTAYAMKGDREKAIDAGCDGYIAKPIDIKSFPQQVARFFKIKPTSSLP